MARLVALTGCTSGLGHEMVKTFIKEGCYVIGCGRKQDKIDKMKSEFLGHFEGMKVDISKEDEVEAWAKQFMHDHGIPSLLINNAGTMNLPKPLTDTDPEEFDKVMRVNANGYFYTIRHFVPSMIRQQKPGVIVNISSAWGHFGASNFGPYCASKFAVEGLTKSLAQELPKPHTVVSVLPGIIGTKMGYKAHGEEVAQRAVTPAEWAAEGVKQILRLDRADNGQSINSPIAELSVVRALSLGQR